MHAVDADQQNPPNWALTSVVVILRRELLKRPCDRQDQGHRDPHQTRASNPVHRPFSSAWLSSKPRQLRVATLTIDEDLINFRLRCAGSGEDCATERLARRRTAPGNPLGGLQLPAPMWRWGGIRMKRDGGSLRCESPSAIGATVETVMSYNRFSSAVALTLM